MPTRATHAPPQMTVLTTTKTWRRPTALAKGRTPDLTDQERASVRRALLFLRTQIGGTAKLAAALGLPFATASHLLGSKGKPGAGVAIRVARLAKVPVDTVLAGEWPPEGACPHCGRV
jgi:hypothetical protein